MTKLEFSPGKWSESLLDGALVREGDVVHNFEHYGKETVNKVTAAAQEKVSQFTVVIGNAEIAEDSKDVQDLVPSTGVFVQLSGNLYGVLTAGHVLRRGDNTKYSASVTIFAPPTSRKLGEDVKAINLLSRPCTVFGFCNETEDGPDIAIIPLKEGERRILDKWGMVAYNIDKERWSEKDKKEIKDMNPWLFSVINGVRYEASRIVYGQSDESRGSLAIMATNTRIEEVAERGGFDYLELPSETTKHSYRTHWRNQLPGTAAQEIESLYDEGVTRRVWGGTSGAGVWNLAIGTTENGLPNGKVFAELAGICFYANPDKGCIIAHGKESIMKVKARHIESGHFATTAKLSATNNLARPASEV